MYEYDGKYIKTIPLNKEGRIMRIESDKHGYWCSSDHTGLEYLLHLYDKDFNLIDEYLKTSTDVVPRIPTFRHPIQCDGNKVCYFDSYDSKFSIIEFGESVKVNSYKLHTGNELTIEKSLKDIDNKYSYDNVLDFLFTKDKIYGAAIINNLPFPFIANLKTNTLNETIVDYFPNLESYHEGYYYAVYSSSSLLEMLKPEIHVSEKVVKFIQEQIDKFKEPLTLESNHVLVRMKLKDLK